MPIDRPRPGVFNAAAAPLNRQARRAAARAGRPAQPTPLELARGLAAAGRLGEAFDAHCAAARAEPPDPIAQAACARFLIDHVPARPHPAIDEIFIAALDQAWLRPEQLVVATTRYLTGGLEGVLALRNMRAAAARTLLASPVLHAMLRATTAATPALDIFLAHMRAAALAAGAPADLLPFMAALAERSARSGFALTLPDDGSPAIATEARGLGQLRAMASRPAEIALLGCYESVAAHPGLDAPALAGVRAAHRDEPEAAKAAAAAVGMLGTIDASSVPVAVQYEAHPYPLWVREPVGLPIALPAAVVRAVGRKPVRDVLVAGCGTGQHALAAADRWPSARILAVDLSRASLGHAASRIGAMEIGRIDFAQADLLAAGSWGRRFDVIESVGVLHHLNDPEAGLAALKGALAPGGVMLIGLYARRARGAIDRAREFAGGLAGDAAAIRAFRARSLARLDAPEILNSPDFYSIGGCRDLVFHVREHRFTLPEIAAMAARQRLTLLAIEPPPLVPTPTPAPDDVEGWDAAERADPRIFGGMYHVWLRTDPAASGA